MNGRSPACIADKFVLWWWAEATASVWPADSVDIWLIVSRTCMTISVSVEKAVSLKLYVWSAVPYDNWCPKRLSDWSLSPECMRLVEEEPDWIVEKDNDTFSFQRIADGFTIKQAVGWFPRHDDWISDLEINWFVVKHAGWFSVHASACEQKDWFLCWEDDIIHLVKSWLVPGE